MVACLLQLKVATDPRYAKDGYGTKCNFYVMDFMHVMGYPIRSMRAHEYIDSWRKGEQPMIAQLTLKNAVEWANAGHPTIACLQSTPPAHVMVVLPQDAILDPAELLISQAGVVNFYGRQMKYGVGSKRAPDVEYYGAL